MKIGLVDPLAPELRRSWLSLLPSFDPDGEDGGGDDGDDGGEDDGGDGDDGEDDGADDKDKVPVTRADVEKVQKALRKQRQESAKLRRELAAAKAGAKPADDKEKESPKNDGPDFRSAAAQTTAFTALKEAGFTGNQRKALRILRDYDLADIEPDKNGFFDPDDFADVIDEVKEDWSELFGKPSRRKASSDDDDDEDEDERPRRRTTSVSRQSAPPQRRSGGGSRRLSADEQFTAKLLDSAGFTAEARRVRSGR